MTLNLYKICENKLKGGEKLNARFTQAMPDELNEKIEKLAEKKGMTKTALINMVMADFIGYFESPMSYYAEIKKRIERIEEKLEEK
jgi:predicted DNA-binding protein